MKKILVTGSTGRFGQVLKEFKTPNKMYYPSKKELNILDYKKILNYLDKVKPNLSYPFSRFISSYGGS